nr:FliC/FljB family flagellin [uncultured Halomonas sp.]
MSVINTNITSMISQQNLASSKGDLTTAMERLSSGLRINSAKDDAAGQAIANRMTSQITGLSQAQRNANDGISVAQTAEGALNQVNDNLQRIRELSVQAANGTNSSADKQSIQDEINQRLGEIDRISSETNFNGVKVLESDQSVSIQVGANDGESISIELKEINSTTLNLGEFNVNGYEGTLTAVTDNDAFTADDGTAVEYDTANSTTTIQDADGNTLTGFTLNTDQQGNRFVTDGTDTYSVTAFAVADAGADTDTDGTNEGNFTVTVDADNSLNQKSANPLAAVDSALSQVDTLRSDLGAIQNRFESAITNLSTNETNLSAARSRIEDADYATEVANMTRGQILQQAGTSVLAQANQLPQSVLSLLG